MKLPLKTTIPQCHSRTDERTDGRLAVAIPRYALQRRAVKTISCWFNAVNPLTPTVAIRVQL